MSVKLDKKYRYIHFLWANELKFNGPLVELINHKENALNAGQTLFITPNEDVYNALSMYPNVILDKRRGCLFNEYAEWCDWMISHGMPRGNALFLLRIHRNVKKKIIYRYWGSGRSMNCFATTHGLLRNFLNKIMLKLYRTLYSFIYGRFAVIGVASTSDIIEFKQKCNQGDLLVFFRLPYAYFAKLNDVDDYKQPIVKSVLNVLIGHRCRREEKHICCIEKLRHFGNKVTMFLPLSYGGDNKYLSEIKEYVKENGLKNVILMEEFMTYPDYTNFLRSIDVAIFDIESSSAMGNISDLLEYGKTFYLSPTGIISKTFDMEKVPYHSVKEIETMSFEQFSKLHVYGKDCGAGFRGYTYQGMVNAWRDFYKYLDSRN